jgi:hypothetical protein
LGLNVTDLLSEKDIQNVTQLLGRKPRGLIDIPVRTLEGDPVVIQVASLVDKKPFPTLYWLIDKVLCYEIDRLEASGYIAELQVQIDNSQALQAQLIQDHLDHIALRNSLMSEDMKSSIRLLGFTNVFEKRGIGGIENFTRIRCLHTYYASHLVTPNTIGKQLDCFWQTQEKTMPALSKS